MKTTILNEIKSDLADNFKSEDESIISNILDEVVTDALSLSNRKETNANLTLLKSNIKKATKSIYLQRGTEDVSSSSQIGNKEKVIETMLHDIIRENKRLLK